MLLDKSFWKNKKILLTGHTGFKGGWLLVFLQSLGANVLGVSLKAEKKSFFTETNLQESSQGLVQDIRDLNKMLEIERTFQPEVLIHLAAQPLVIESYKDPITTFTTNIIGTANILEIIRLSSSIKSGVIITTDKCYENRNLTRGYKEDDPMGGHDPYSSSKGSAELVISSYQRSFFTKEDFNAGSAAIGSVRAGNVIGGGDWGKDRLIPDLVKSAENKSKVKIRNPSATRPWQHVLEPLYGYLLVAEKLFNQGPTGSDNWNFGPKQEDVRKVSTVADMFCDSWGDDLSWSKGDPAFHEAANLMLDITKSKETLGWEPRWPLSKAIDKIVDWHKAHLKDQDCLSITKDQIVEFIDQ